MVEQTIQRIQKWFQRIKPAYVGWAIVVVGGILRVRQYFSGRSLWGDEAALALNIVERSFAGLTQPLAYDQGAPIGFLFLEKIMILLFGNHDQVLRLVPLVSAIISVYFFYYIAKSRIQGGLLGTLLFVTSVSLIFYASELKQYSSDVAVVLLLVFLADFCLRVEARPRDFWALGITGMIAIWMSHPSAFVIAGIGLALFFAAVTKSYPVPVKWLFILAGMWGLSFGLEYFVSLRHLAASENLLNYWKGAFMPLPHGGTRAWFVSTYESLLFTTLHVTDPIISFLVLFLTPIGVLSLLYRDRIVAIIMVSPFFIALLASVAHKYPLANRFMLFLVPFVLLLIAEGLGCIYRLITKWNIWVARTIYIMPALILFFLPATRTWNYFLHPPADQNIRPVLQYVADHYQQGDYMYVYHTSRLPFQYYAPFYYLDHLDILAGRTNPTKRLTLKHFYEDVETLTGRERVWFIFSGITRCSGCSKDTQTFYVDYLDKQGTMLDHFDWIGANAYLYDLHP